MHDIALIRSDPAAFDTALGRRGLPPQSPAILALDAKRRELQTRIQQMLARRNEASKLIGAAKAKGQDAQALLDEVARLKTDLPAAEAEEAELARQLTDRLAALPNLPARDVPDGPDEHANVELRRVGEPPRHNFPVRSHDEIGVALGLMDFEAAARLSGARFVVLRGGLARMERALAQFMLDLHTTEFGYTEIQPPLLVREHVPYGTGQLPKAAEDMFHTTDGFWLIPTAEVPLTNLVADRILDADELPLRMTAFTPCFRSEAGAAGRDTRGMIRQHQFPKVELVSITRPDQSEAEHARMTECAETVLKRLGLAYRTMALSTGDMGFAAAKTYDIEVWLPAQGTYREISSCSNCRDFQARRMKARFRAAGDKATTLVHSLNGSALAVGRTMVAILENYQQSDGSVAIPAALQPYMGGLSELRP